MCMNVDGNKTLVCTVGDLKPGQQYRTPEGETRVLVDERPGFDSPPGYTLTLDIATGKVHTTSNDVKLGTDRAGRLYASRFLNGWVKPTVTVG